jgi:hypothetical protein
VREVPWVDGAGLARTLFKLAAKRPNTGMRDIGQPFVVAVTGDLEQLFNTSASDRGDDAELGEVSSDRIDNCLCCRMNRWRVRWSIRQLCCSVVFVATNRIFALVTASQIASASAESFFCRLT